MSDLINPLVLLKSPTSISEASTSTAAGMTSRLGQGTAGSRSGRADRSVDQLICSSDNLVLFVPHKLPVFQGHLNHKYILSC